MKKTIPYIVFTVFTLMFAITGIKAAGTKLKYQTHVQNIGWQKDVADENISGTQGQSLRLEGIKISFNEQAYSGNIEYRTHIQNIGWESTWHKNGEMAGTEGRSLRLEAIQLKLTGTIASYYDVYYRVHAQNFGWLGWTKNGEMAGTAGYGYRLEAIQIKLVSKGGTGPTSAIEAYKSPKISYQTHIQNIGWQGEVHDNEVSGTQGQSLRTEGLKLKINDAEYSGDILYKSHIQNIGWESTWHKNGDLSGTTGRGLRLEAVQIKLSGTIASYYDVYYRAYVQNHGWLGWAKNGATAGTLGYGLRLESIQVKLIKKTSNEEKPSEESGSQIIKDDQTVVPSTPSTDVPFTPSTGGNIKVNSISLSKIKVEVKAGESFKVKATISPSSVSSDNVVWSSSDPNVAVVDNNGNITGVNGGTATIYARISDKQASVPVNVIGRNKYDSYPTYTSRKVVKKINLTNSNIMFYVSNDAGCGTGQGFTVAKNNLITFQRNGDDTNGVISIYSKSGKLLQSKVHNFGHGNGMTYNPNTDTVYVVGAGGSENNKKKIWTFSYSNFLNSGKLNLEVKYLPDKITGIAYDGDLNVYHAKNGINTRTYDTNFNKLYEFQALGDYTGQDIGYHDGLILVIRYDGSVYANYIDLYRSNDYKYIGTYEVLSPGAIKDGAELESIAYSGQGNTLYLYYNYVGTDKAVVVSADMDFEFLK